MVKYVDYQIKDGVSDRDEDIVWSITYKYNANDTESPRVLLIGDSICNAYQNAVRVRTGTRVNISFWASSKCITHKDYLRELDYILDANPCELVFFNNGLHSLNTDTKYWENAYREVVRFIADKLPDAKLTAVLSTPLKEAKLTERSKQLNDIVKKVSAENNTPVLDLFAPMDEFDRNTYWTDCFHFKADAISIQADLITKHIFELLPDCKEKVVQKSTLTGPDGALK